MTYDEFVKEYNGKSIDFDGAYGVQCTDLIKQYAKDVLGVSVSKSASWGNAYKYWTNTPSALSKVVTKITNTASFIPQKGDIMVFNTGVGSGAGHVSICTGEGTTSYFYSYDQNWNTKPMHKVKHDYKNVYGVLRPKDQTVIQGVSYTIGETYTLQTNLKVRTGPGTNYAQKTVSQLTSDGQKNCTTTKKTSGAVLKSGTKVTCKGTTKNGNDIWMTIPSGYVAAYYDGNVYIK